MKSKKLVLLFFTLSVSLAACNQYQEDRITNMLSDSNNSQLEQIYQSGSPTQPSDSEMEAAKSLILLKDGNTKDLIGFSFGDVIDYSFVDKTGEYFEGGEICLLKNGDGNNIILFFSNEDERFSGMAAFNTGNFFGINMGVDSFQKVYDILGLNLTHKSWKP